jgi:uncharacterized protein YndB with AHSA1/START domain
MTHISTTIFIARPVEQVFDFVTTPANWPRWHPSSLGVSGAVEHSLVPGEQVTEDYLVAGRRGRAIWTVRERVPPHRWVIDGRVEAGGGGRITYILSPRADGTEFRRDFVYEVPGLPLKLLNWLVLRRRIAAESAEALRRLKQVLELE